MKESTRDKGKYLENMFLGYLKVYENNARLSNNSGAVSNNGDILSKYFQIECKNRSTKNAIS